MSKSAKLVPFVALAVLAGCATVPKGPAVTVLPGANKSFDQFRLDNSDCQLFADQSVGESASSAAENSAVRSAAVSTAVGAAAGALIGAVTGSAGTGAAIGAGGGLVVGSAGGHDAYGHSANTVQGRYDTAYMQCMYTKGHQIPVPADYRASSTSRYQSQSTENTYVPPPPGSPPPPPPDANL